MMIFLQLFSAGPQGTPRQAASSSGMHVHFEGEPLQTSLAAHGTQTPSAAQPLFSSRGTQAEPHFFVPAGQVSASSQVPCEQNRSQLPAGGTQALSWQPDGPQPYRGSLAALQAPLHSL
jgi:hypothetical protein